MQGFNMGRYVPPEHEGLTSANRLQKKHPLGSRARKPGILVVRFEMPYPIWCATCPKPTIIGQGVRFNAEKKKVGQYHTTPIYSFALKHSECGGAIIIQTDPKNTDYEIISGARRRDLGAQDDEGAIQTPREQAESRSTAISLLEKTISDREKLIDSNMRIEELQDATGKHWDDPYALNQRLRKAFRAGRHEREKQSAAAEDIKERMSLGIDLLPSTEEDARRAALVDFGSGVEQDSDRKVLAKPLFDTAITTVNNKKQPNTLGGRGGGKNNMLKSEIASKKLKANLVSEIVSNTRAARDPFLGFGNTTNNNNSSGPKAGGGGGGLLPGLKKRKRAAEDQEVREATSPTKPDKEEKSPSSKAAAAVAVSAGPITAPLALVNYDSDSDS
ncbi:CWC16 protein [Cladorrhinum sp. PSN332]|nr:CWC16 protein [Cladorrhinum sp. PSN332]